MSTDKIATYKVGATPLFAEEAQPPSSLYNNGGFSAMNREATDEEGNCQVNNGVQPHQRNESEAVATYWKDVVEEEGDQRPMMIRDIMDTNTDAYRGNDNKDQSESKSPDGTLAKIMKEQIWKLHENDPMINNVENKDRSRETPTKELESLIREERARVQRENTRKIEDWEEVKAAIIKQKRIIFENKKKVR